MLRRACPIDDLRRTARSDAIIGIAGGMHAMLRRHATFGRLAEELTMTTLSDRPTLVHELREPAHEGTPVDA